MVVVVKEVVVVEVVIVVVVVGAAAVVLFLKEWRMLSVVECIVLLRSFFSVVLYKF